MKQSFKHIILVLGLLVSTMTLQAQVTSSYKNQGGVATGKSVSGPNADGTYTIKLETFATGTSHYETSSTPVDVILVLDVSGSMEEPKGSYTVLPNYTEISYNTVANSSGITYFYYDDGYNKVYPEISGGRYRLYYIYDGKQYIGNSRTTADGTIVTVRNSNMCTAKESRMDALKPAVKKFINNIAYNSTHYKDSTARPDGEHLDNRLSIIKFSDNAQRLCPLTTVEGNVRALEGYIDGLESGGGTATATGINLANDQLANASPDANKVVVLFTDGAPTDGYNAIGSSTGGSTYAYRAKHTYNASVFTIGLFAESPVQGVTRQNNVYIWEYLNYISSNYPNATGNGRNYSAGTGGSDQGFYKDASGDVDLTAIFNDISGGIGGSDEPIGTSTEIRDVVTSSFTIPDGFTASNVRTSVWKIDEDGNGWTEDEDYDTEGIKPEIGKKTYIENGVEVQKDTVGVTGFDFSKDDSEEQKGDGNWVGIRYRTKTETFYAGRKLVIEFEVREKEAATGGIGTATNTEESGVYVNGNPINTYDIPHTTLPVNITITKTGLRHGESATFQIFKIGPKMIPVTDKDGNVIKSKVDPQQDSLTIDYNAIGKPKPNVHDYTPEEGDDAHDILEGQGWEKWSKVILTNKGADKAAVTKTLLALDPNWIYLVSEDDWGWAYEVTGSGGTQTTSTVELNPFTFVNTEKTGIVKHAEAVSINHFGYTIEEGEFEGKQEEHYKSSKVEKL